MQGKKWQKARPRLRLRQHRRRALGKCAVRPGQLCWVTDLPSGYPLPSPGQYLPAGQAWQALGDRVPSRGFRVPSWQGKAEGVPAGQQCPVGKAGASEHQAF